MHATTSLRAVSTVAAEEGGREEKRAQLPAQCAETINTTK